MTTKTHLLLSTCNFLAHLMLKPALTFWLFCNDLSFTLVLAFRDCSSLSLNLISSSWKEWSTEKYITEKLYPSALETFFPGTLTFTPDPRTKTTTLFFTPTEDWNYVWEMTNVIPIFLGNKVLSSATLSAMLILFFFFIYLTVYHKTLSTFNFTNKRASAFHMFLR